MKKVLAFALVAIFGVSVVSAAGVVVAASTQAATSNTLPAGLPAAASPDNPKDPNPTTSVLPIWGSTIQVQIRVTPLPILVTMPKTNQLIGVTISYQKNFDPLAYNLETFTFGRTGTEASPVAQVVSDVGGHKDLTLIFRASDCGFRLGDTKGILTGTVMPNGCWNSKPVHCDIVPPPWYHITVTGTASVLVL